MTPARAGRVPPPVCFMAAPRLDAGLWRTCRLACDGPAVILPERGSFPGRTRNLPIPDMARAARRAGCGRKPSGSCRLETAPRRRRHIAARPPGAPTPARPARRRAMAENRGVVYMGQGRVEVQPPASPSWRIPAAGSHGAILKVVATNIAVPISTWCAAAPRRPRAWCWGMRLPARSSRSAPTWETLRVGDLRPCHRSTRPRPLPLLQGNRTRACLNVNPDRPGGAYGYVDMGGWIGGQALLRDGALRDFNLLRFPTRRRPWRRSAT